MKIRRKITIILLSILFVGLSLLLYPSVSSYWNSITQSRAITDYDALVKTLTPKDYSAMIEAAEDYNKKLAALPFSLTDYRELEGYHDLLNAAGDGIMGYIDIDKIQVKLPIYHTTDPAILNNACGHMEGSSLPIGGSSTHCVLSAHRGLPSAKLFTDLDRLEVGDVFCITVLGTSYVYQVDQIKTVLPTDVNDLLIEPGKDYCTLVTCTPYGINTHRLLVRGHQVDAKDIRVLSVNSEAYIVGKLIVAPIVALPIILVLIVLVFLEPAKPKLPINEEGELL